MHKMLRPVRKQFRSFEKELASQRDQIRKNIDRRRLDVVIAHNGDDEAAAAVENSAMDMLLGIQERERRTLGEIESAFVRLKKGEYGICDHCRIKIPRARLEALPWARLCVRCAEHATNSSGLRVAF